MKRVAIAVGLALLAGACQAIPLLGSAGSSAGIVAWFTLAKEINDDALLIGGNIERVICGIERNKVHAPDAQEQIEEFCTDLPDDLLTLAAKGIELWQLVRDDGA